MHVKIIVIIIIVIIIIIIIITKIIPLLDSFLSFIDIYISRLNACNPWKLNVNGFFDQC